MDLMNERNGCKEGKANKTMFEQKNNTETTKVETTGLDKIKKEFINTEQDNINKNKTHK